MERHDLGRGVILTLDQESPGSSPGGATRPAGCTPAGLRLPLAPPLLQRLALSSCERHITLSPDRGGPVYTVIHVVLSLVGIFAGLVVAGGLVAGR